MSTPFSPTATVAPAKAGAGLFFCDLASVASAAKGSLAPDQVRGDEVWEAAE